MTKSQNIPKFGTAISLKEYWTSAASCISLNFRQPKFKKKSMKSSHKCNNCLMWWWWTCLFICYRRRHKYSHKLPKEKKFIKTLSLMVWLTFPSKMVHHCNSYSRRPHHWTEWYACRGGFTHGFQLIMHSYNGRDSEYSQITVVRWAIAPFKR